MSRPGHRPSNGAHDALVENAGHDVVFGEVVFGDDASDGMGGSQFHSLIDLSGTHVQRTAEDPGRRKGRRK
jgi:hypothetical protein